ncbi:hypothetical protein [Solimonas sp. SE-A11]|uniref:hypothetical protein n=1 Tax=Solimonas sp. SE-A11 TaxID=3054954 RepID=UPI00259CCE2B|nr:hypothetical protein [Solimonas sp. SE-A11]MDM4773033.1 hypothetical protein [Solimonas sp. SE-A11]
MRRQNIYFIDEDAAARRSNGRSLKELLGSDEIEIRPIEPRPALSDYNDLISEPDTAAFILDQRMKGGGRVNYNGTDLARQVRSINSKMPIYILTGHADEKDDFLGSEHLVENIIGKDAIDNTESEGAQVIKARILRHLNVFGDMRTDRENRFHELLIKSLREGLSEDEQQEMDRLEGESTAPVIAKERELERVIGAQVDSLQKFLQSQNNLLK